MMKAPERLDGESDLHYGYRTSIFVPLFTVSLHDAIFERMFGVEPCLDDWIFVVPPYIAFEIGLEKVAVAPSDWHVAQYFYPEFKAFL